MASYLLIRKCNLDRRLACEVVLEIESFLYSKRVTLPYILLHGASRSPSALGGYRFDIVLCGIEMAVVLRML